MAFDHPWQPPEAPPESVDDRTAAIMFKKMIRKFEQVRNVSSPVLKLITIHRLMNEVMAAVNDSQTSGGPHEADNLIEIIFYLLVQLQSSEAKFLGARFVEECTYIDSFIHEDQIGLIEEYANIEHMQVVLTQLEKGLKKCEKIFITPGSSSSSSGTGSSSRSSAVADVLDN